MLAKKEVFQSITGYNGAACTEGWEDMTREQLKQQIEGLCDNFYNFHLNDTEIEKVIDTIEAYKSANQTDGYHLYESLED